MINAKINFILELNNIDILNLVDLDLLNVVHKILARIVFKRRYILVIDNTTISDI